MDKDGALGELLAAEANYLRSRGWIPVTTPQGIAWRDPNRFPGFNRQQESVEIHRNYRQEVAIALQREREPND